MDNTNLDSLGIEKSLTLFPDQIKTTYKQAIDSNIEKLEFTSVVMSGMGGSSNAGKIIQSWQEPVNKIPFTVFNAYGLPNWVDTNTLVILNSYSGNTEETLSAYSVAKEKGCKVIGITTGGKVGDLIKSGEIKGAIVAPGDTNPSGYPKSGLGLSLGALLGALEKVGFITSVEPELNSALKELAEIRNGWNATDLTKWIDNGLPVYFGSHELVGALNAGRNATCEIGRTYTQFYDFPEVNHVLIESLQIPDTVKKNKYIFFESKMDHERVKIRYQVTKKLMDRMGLSYTTYEIKHQTLLGQLLEIAHIAAWIGFHLSIARNDDPGPEPWIIELKTALAQPVH